MPVIVGGTYRLPRRRGDAYDAAYAAAGRAARGRHPLLHLQLRTGSAPATSATCPTTPPPPSAFGLPADEALKAITLYPAQILGVADRVGSLEAGKDATLFVADGDPLDTPTQVDRRLDPRPQGRSQRPPQAALSQVRGEVQAVG